jgi:undecaprenyl-diphosphatase
MIISCKFVNNYNREEYYCQLVYILCYKEKYEGMGGRLGKSGLIMLYYGNGGFRMDNVILIGIQEYIRNDYLTPIMLLVTAVGNFGAIWLLMGGLLAISRRTREQGILSLVSILFCGGVGECIKHIVMRPRPFLQIPELTLLGPLPHSFSFPSGHTICAFALVFTIWRMRRGWIRIWLMAFAVVMAFSRLYLGAHYPTDVLAGLVLAYLGSMFIWCIRKKIVNVNGYGCQRN